MRIQLRVGKREQSFFFNKIQLKTVKFAKINNYYNIVSKSYVNINTVAGKEISTS